VKNYNFVIEKAKVTQSSGKIGIMGPPGSGKTFTALTIASKLGDKILVIDTENGSSTKYANIFHFNVIKLTDYQISTYLAALEYVKEQQYDVVIVDSLSHAWAGKGGALELVEKIAKAKYHGNTFAAWSEVTPLQEKLVDMILTFPSHLIATIRTKIDYILVQNAKGRTEPKKVGTKLIQRDTVEYEFDILAQMDVDHNLIVTKTRYFELDGFIENKPGEPFALQIKTLLEEGTKIPVFPHGWNPSTKEEFFREVTERLHYEIDSAIQILHNGGIERYDPQKIVEMWQALQNHKG
jgi:Ni2+-binding GTPase involved in maturation of urease and hydrogenase